MAQNEGGQHKKASDSYEAPWSTWRGFADGRLGVFTFHLTPDCSTTPTPPCHSLRPKTLSPIFPSGRFAVRPFPTGCLLCPGGPRRHRNTAFAHLSESLL
jgi:hypothetical protein